MTKVHKHITVSLRPLTVPVAKLKIDPDNVREHDERSIDAITASLKEFGQRKPIVVQKKGMLVRAGNGTVEAAKRLKWTHIAAVVINEPIDRSAAYAIADNRTAEHSTWGPNLADVLARLNPDLQAVTGFGADEIRDILAMESSQIVEPPPAPAPVPDPVTRQGDMWALGDHRVRCGDAGAMADVAALMGGMVADMVNTDPPWNVGVMPRSTTAINAGNSTYESMGGAASATMRPKDRTIENDKLSDEDFRAMVAAWFANIAAVTKPGGGVYLWGGWGNCEIFPSAMRAAGIHFAQPIIWDKVTPLIGRSDYMRRHDWGFYGWREGKAHAFYGPGNDVDVWTFKAIGHTATVHTSEKPVALAAHAIENSSRPGEIVLDLFAGSGSTILAAEQMDRVAYAMELDPVYVDVIVRRWNETTGKPAVLVDDGREFGDVEKERKHKPHGVTTNGKRKKSGRTRKKTP